MIWGRKCFRNPPYPINPTTWRAFRAKHLPLTFSVHLFTLDKDPVPMTSSANDKQNHQVTKNQWETTIFNNIQHSTTIWISTININKHHETMIHHDSKDRIRGTSWPVPSSVPISSAPLWSPRSRWGDVEVWAAGGRTSWAVQHMAGVLRVEIGEVDEVTLWYDSKFGSPYDILKMNLIAEM